MFCHISRIYKENVKKIVDDFLSIPKYDLDKKPEEQIKFQFIEPLLEALGWGKKDIEKEEKSEKAPFNKY